MFVDIKCAKCGTEYELEEDRIPPQGLTVKCTSCGFIFKAAKPVSGAPGMHPDHKKTMLMYASPVVFPAVAVVPPAPAAPPPVWVVRTAEGAQFSFNDLASLQMLVRDNKVRETDQISRQGEGWRTIADIPEFAGFFIVKAVSTPPPPAPVQAPPAAPSMPPPAVAGPAPVAAPPPPAPVVAVDRRIENAIPRPSREPDLRVEETIPRVQAAEPGHAEAEAHFNRPLSDTDFENLDVYGRPKKPIGLIIGIAGGAVGLLIVAAIALRFLSPATFSSIFGTEPVFTKAQETEFKEAMKGIDTNEPASLAAAVEKLAKYKPDEKDEHAKIYTKAVAAMAMANMAWGEPLRDEGLDLKARLDEIMRTDPALTGPMGGEARKLNEDFIARLEDGVKRIETGRELAKSALRQNAESPEANIVYADYYRIQFASDPGALQNIKKFVEEAEKAKGAQENPYLLLVKGGAMLKAESTADDGMKIVKKALELNPKLTRAHYVLARHYLGAKKQSEAQSEIDAILREAADSPVAKVLVAAMGRIFGGAAAAAQAAGDKPESAAEPEKKEEPKEVEPQAAKEAPAEPKKEAAVEPKAAKEEKKAAKAETAEEGGGAAKAGAGYESSLRQAARLRNAGKTKQAMEFFQKAAEADPSRADPHSGLGWCYIELEKFDLAIGEFKKALTLKGVKCEALSGLGESYKYKKNRQEAINHYQRYLQECPNGPDAPVARNAINSMR
ncbi:MAG: zinc-ribbon domain-containing protein [Deltaproteobacteria bacterium]|nr:zinc-ribbon domain-containing protein [Deltaproteobacteria bacterium]